MKKKTIEFNLAQLDEKTMIEMLDDNDTDIAELFTLLEALFDMWSSALKFSAVVVTYGEQQFDGFLKTFIKTAAPANGIAPERLARILKTIKPPVIH